MLHNMLGVSISQATTHFLVRERMSYLKFFLPLITGLFLLLPGQAIAQEPLTGEIRMIAGSTIPDGWLAAEGTCQSKTTYAVLYAEIGDVYDPTGSLCVSTDFLLPNFVGRFPLGEDPTGQTIFGHPDYPISRGDRGGEDRHVLTENEMPSHDHPRNPSGHTEYYVDTLAGSFGYRTDSVAHYGLANTTGITGGDLPHENMPPYQAVKFIIFSGVYQNPTPTPTATSTPTETPTPTPTLTPTPIITNTPVATGTAVFLPQIYGSTYTHTLESGNVAAVPLEISAGQLLIITSVLSVCGAVVLQLVHKVVAS